MNDLSKEIADEVKSIYRETLDPIKERFSFRERSLDGEITGGPMVLVVGNHSAGKSTFINYLMDKDVQKTGMAPTDDGFTILRNGSHTRNFDGAAVIGNPDLPFGSLKQFGDNFASHLRMRLLPNDFLEEVTLIDTPGMIDTVESKATRGYDFNGVVRWFAERSDIVLVFFDPDRPGTTIESLNVLTNALKGMHHKLMVVMNKMDNFRSIRDFARCYGALCWNLGKVIESKDIPQIYTTYVPVDGAPKSPLPLEDFTTARQELIDEIRQAPERRINNMVTDCAHYAGKLDMFTRIMNGARQRVVNLQKLLYLLLFIGILTAATIAYYYFKHNEIWSALLTLAATVGATFLLHLLFKKILAFRARRTIDTLDGVFGESYKKELATSSNSNALISLWRELKPRVHSTLNSMAYTRWPSLRKRENKRLEHCINGKLPNLLSKLHAKLNANAPSASQSKRKIADAGSSTEEEPAEAALAEESKA